MSRTTRAFLVSAFLAMIAAGGFAATGNGLWNAYMIPGAAHLPGDMGSFWQTDVFITNPHAHKTIVVTIKFLRELTNNTGAQVRNYTIDPGKVLVLDDVVWNVFGLTTKGALYVWSDSVFMATARTYTGQPGTYGQTIPGQDYVQYGEETAFTTGVRNAGNYRSNIGVVNWSSAALTVVAEVYDSSGTFLGSRTFTLQPWSNEQTSASNVAGQFAAGYIKWRCTTTASLPAWIAYASVADNVTNDAVFLNERVDDFYTDRNPAYDLTGTWTGVFSSAYTNGPITAVVFEDEASVSAYIYDNLSDAYVAFLHGYEENGTVTFTGWSKLYTYWNDSMWGTATVTSTGTSLMGTFDGTGFFTGGGTVILNKVSSSTGSATFGPLAPPTPEPGAPRPRRR
jgi:hypothetical protein